MTEGQVYPAIREKRDTLHFQQEALDSRSSKYIWGAEAAVPVYDPMAGEPLRGPRHRTADDSAGSGPTGQKGDLSIGGDLSGWNLRNKLIYSDIKGRRGDSHRNSLLFEMWLDGRMSVDKE